MCDIDLGEQFDVIATQPEAASEQLRAVSQRSTDQRRSAAENTHRRPTMAANRFREKAAGHVSGSSRWHDLRAKWQAQVVAAQVDIDKVVDEVEASYAIADADLAGSYALEAIHCTQSAIDQTESALLDAMYCRTRQQRSTAEQCHLP